MNHQVFTPEEVVKKMLSLADFDGNLVGKRILESSFGQGNILIEIVKKYIHEGKEKGLSNESIRHLLERNIYGVELDEVHYKKCLYQLNELVDAYKISKVNWNLYNIDALKIEWKLKFDIIIGNPPYIKYHNIQKEERDWLRNNFQTCQKGNFDYYYAFLEKDYNLLSPTGKLVYLVPNNVFKNVYANKLRELIKNNLVAIYDFTSTKVFNKILTTSAIIYINKESNLNKFTYYDVPENKSIEIEKRNMKDKWVFNELLNHLNTDIKFGDLFKVQMGVATLLNKAYILKGFEEHINYYIKGNQMIEKKIVKDAVSPRSLFYGRVEKIIFPYKIESDVERYSSEEFSNIFPLTKKYLSGFCKELKSRQSNSNISWFEYGRSQALDTVLKDRLLLSTLITKKVKVYEVKPDVIIYSGVSIHAKKNNDLKLAKNILESHEFLKYVKNVGVNSNGSSLRISARDISEFPISKFINKEKW